MIKIFFSFFLINFLLTLAGCSSSTGVQSQCVFTRTVYVRDSLLAIKLPGDKPEVYTYKTNNVTMDTLLSSLCSKGFQISEAWYSIEYLCADARGPLPEIVLQKQDSSIRNYGFEQGNYGRLACSDSLYRYTP